MNWKHTQKIFLLIFSYLCVSCVSYSSNENERYHFIKTTLAQERYSAVSNNSRAFEKDFPNSRHLCELWALQIATYKSRSCCDFFLRQAEDNYKNKCPLVKDENSNKK